MKLHRFIGDFDLSKNEIKIKNPENIKQIKGVLRLGIGDSLILADGRGKQLEVSIVSLSNNEIVCEIVAEIPMNEPDRKVSLYLAILKKENFELAVQKAVECGVTQIIPIITERTIKTGINIKRLEKIILEASEQCERSIVPKLQKTMQFENAMAYGYGSEEKFIFHPGSSGYGANKSAKRISIFVGPEGGFTNGEIEFARTAGYRVASLGDLILRGETAATIAVYRTVQGM